MPPRERQRIHGLIQKHDWARAEQTRLRAAAAKGDGYAAAFLFALGGDAKHADTARQWLLGRYNPKSYWVNIYRQRLADPKWFKAGQPGIPDVYYDIDITGLVAFDWVYKALPPADRKTIEDGLLTFARFKMRCMDRWTQTPNLVFKPTFLVAMTGLATGNKECLAWGFERTRPWGPHIGGYFPVLDAMLKDGGPWHEAPIYPGAHTGLFITAQVSRYGNLFDGKDWFGHKGKNGGSPKGLMDYYLDSAYPIEKTGVGAGQVRVANYGDGSTNGMGDLFLVSPTGNKGDILLHEPLVAAYNVSGDSRYAAFVSMIPGYKPDLWERRPLPAKAEMPAAPSKVWPDYGLAMLRSDESPSYWTSGKAIAVFQLMSQGYGHDHRDKFSISLHGAGRLFYPNYNAIQYENPAIGWTRNSASHNTLVVDEGETGDARPTGIRYEFAPEVKFLATSASGVFEGVDQTRALLLTREYLLDVFQASSKVPHTYDYLLHSFGKAQPARPDSFKPSEALVRRYWLVEKQKAMATAEPWSLDFVIKEQSGSRKGNYGKEWYDHTARLRLTMAAEPRTQVVYGEWGEQLAKLVGERHKSAKLDRLTMLAARRAGVRDTVFVAVHEPFANADRPRVRAVSTLVRDRNLALVRIDGNDFTDYVAVSFDPQGRAGYLVPTENATFAFRNYGYLRVARGGVTARGGWSAFTLKNVKGPLTLNGKPAATKTVVDTFVYDAADHRPLVVIVNAKPEKECPFPVTVAASSVRVFPRDRRALTFTIKNTLAKALEGRLTFELPRGVTVEPVEPKFGPVRPGSSAEVRVTFVSANPVTGRHTVPYRVHYKDRDKEVSTGARAVTLLVGPTLEYVYEHPRPYFLVRSPQLTAKFDMFHGLCRYLADDDDTVRLKDAPLFTFGDGKTELLGEGTKRAFTWPREAPADLVAHAYDRCRWQALFFGGRMLIRMDPGWTQFERTYFTIPGRWQSPGGPPRWKRIVAVDGAGKEQEAQPGTKVKVTAAELEFPGGKWNLAFKFEPPQEVAFRGTEMKFSLGSLSRDNWQVGFCRPGQLDAWRGKK
jgi:hypothetical protein